VLLDTNVLIAQGNGEFTLFFEGLTTQRIVISVINRIELLAGPRLTEPQRSALVSLLDEFQEVSLTDEVVSMTIELLLSRQVKRLPDAIIADLLTWVKMGAPDPRDGVKIEAKRGDKSWWSLQPLAKQFAHDGVDGFIIAKLAEKMLTLNPPADPRAL
jgi:predicted nucleic acid-binding protein